MLEFYPNSEKLVQELTKELLDTRKLLENFSVNIQNYDLVTNNFEKMESIKYDIYNNEKLQRSYTFPIKNSEDFYVYSEEEIKELTKK